MRLAARGLRDLDHGVESVTDPAAKLAARRQAWSVQWRSILAAALLTGLYLIVT
ncbi:MAG TPA: hypothetical protein VFZ69_04325 [Longimicrobiales bacterium]